MVGLTGAKTVPTTKEKDTPKKKKKQKLEVLDLNWLSVPKGGLVNDERLAATTEAMARWHACKRQPNEGQRAGGAPETGHFASRVLFLLHRRTPQRHNAHSYLLSET